MAGDFDLSARITGDASGLVQAGAQGEAAIAGLARSEREAATAATALETATGKISTATARAAAAQKSAAAAMESSTAAANRNAYAVRNIGQQFGDFGLQVASGADVARAFGQQAGQLGFALGQLEKGPLASIGRFLVGPWGIAFTIAAAFIAPVVEGLFKTADAAKAAEVATSGLSDAESALADIFGKASSKIAEQNELLKLNARIKAINLRADAAKATADAQQAFANTGRAGAVAGGLRAGAIALTGQDPLGALGIGRGNDAAAALAQRARAAAFITDPATQGKLFDQILKDTEKTDFAGSKTDKAKFIESISGYVASRANNRIADLLDSSLNAGKIDPLLVKAGAGAKPKKPPSTAARDEFGRDAADKIAGIVGQFDAAPSVIDKTNAKVRELDDLIDDLARKKPPGFEGLIKSAEDAKVVVRDGLIAQVAKAFEQPKTLADKAAVAIGQLDASIADLAKNQPPGFEHTIATARQAQGVIVDAVQRPFRDFLKDQEQSLEIGRLTLAGQTDQANALKTIQQLEATMGPLDQARKDAVLATTQALREQNAEIDKIRANNAKYVEAVGGIKSAVEDATQAFVRGDLGQLLKSPGKILDVFQTLQGRKLFDSLFGDAFRGLEDQANGVQPVKEAGERAAAAIEQFGGSTSSATTALGSFTSAVQSAASAASGGAGGLFASGNGNPPPVNILGGGGGLSTAAAIADVVVKGRVDPIVSSLGKVATSITGLFTNPTTAKLVGQNIGKYAGGALQGAATGTFVAGIGKSLGINLSQTGAQLGGALGGVLNSVKSISKALGPFGEALAPVLSVVGGLLGNVFRKVNYGTASIGAGGINVSGNDAQSQGAANSLAGAVQSGLDQIAQQLGGVLGDYSVAIGTFDGKYRVNSSATNASLNFKNFGPGTLQDFGKDGADAAVAAAIIDALKDGAVGGLSAAVTKALSSNTDLNKALKDALGVKNLELLLGGLPASLKQIFDTEAAAAKERVRLATAYGVDIVATEKLNEQQRLDLIDSTLKSRIGSLSDFLDSLKFGDLAAGTPAEQRQALLGKIATVQADAEAGKAGAADQLANLFNQLISTDKNLFGTAGDAYSTDRANAQSVIEKIIQLETDRVNQAAKDSAAGTDTTSALETNNTLTNESNDLLAQILAAVKSGGGTVISSIVGGGGGVDVTLTRRASVL